jgi:hypothetical protein
MELSAIPFFYKGKSKVEGNSHIIKKIEPTYVHKQAHHANPILKIIDESSGC